MNITFDEQQTAALEHPLESGLLFILGAAGSGKSSSLRARIERAIGRSTLRIYESAGNVHDLAMEVLTSHPQHSGLAADLEIIDEVAASMLFERSCESLLTLEWTEFVQDQIDPEIPGLRAPQRFVDAAFRLIRKLRDAQISPAGFLEVALRGAAQFYGKPPNFSHPDLLYYTKDSYRDSLGVTPAQLQHQYRREVDLAKILGRLYRTYVESQVQHGCLTAGDAVAEATRLLIAHPEIAGNLRRTFGGAFIDDAQQLTGGAVNFLQAFFGDSLSNVTFCGDAESAIGTFAGARPDRVFSLPGARIVLETDYRTPRAVQILRSHITGAITRPALTISPEPAVTLFRAATRRAEAAFIAEHIVALLETGAAHEQIALLFRSVRNVEFYESALLERNVRTQTVGDLNLFNEPAALDALALLWNVHDPYRHDWLLRTLSGRAIGLSDASLYALCNEPPDGQALLFEPEAANAVRSSRWDAKRDLRLGWNVTRAEQDDQLSQLARDRLLRFRNLREGWVRDRARLPLPALAEKIFSEGLARDGTIESATAGHQRDTVERLMARIAGFSESHEAGTLGDFLDYAERRSTSDFESCEDALQAGGVRLMSIDSARGREFDHVIIPNVRAGSFPHYYVPDSFLYSPSLGMIAKDNVGEATASRTAKFSYYMFAGKAREQYNKEERRAFAYALARARSSVLITASERATRGFNTPEFLAEIQAAGLAGCIDLSDRWHPTGLRFAR